MNRLLVVYACFIFLLVNATAAAQQGAKIPYGNNVAAGKYVDVGGARLYYETYGTGKPFVLLHGGVYGYIDEFESFIEKLSKQYQVICIATRGHGKSEAGSDPFTYAQRASDIYKVVRSITKDSVTVLGFSDGGYTAFTLAAEYPELVGRMIVIGAGDVVSGARRHKFNYTRKKLMDDAPGFFKSRLSLMPEPAKWDMVLSRLNALYNNSTVSTKTFAKIKAPTLLMAGDRDEYLPVENVMAAAKAITNAQLSIIPGCGHVVFFCNFPAVWEAIQPFLLGKRQTN